MSTSKHPAANPFTVRVGSYIKMVRSTLRHKALVAYAAWFYTKTPIWRILKHDMSKFSRIEFFAYAAAFHRGQEHNIKLNSAAWLHHKTKNDHHWEHWVTTDFVPTPKGQISETGGSYKMVALAMSEPAIEEMIADWFAASRHYGGKWPTDEVETTGEWEWFDNAYPRFQHLLHQHTRQRLYVRFEQIFGPDQSNRWFA